MPDNGLYVFDSSAVIAFLQREPGAEVVAEILKDPRNRCLIHAINVCEVYYDVYRRSSEEDASGLEEILITTGLKVVEAIPSPLWQTAGKLKAEWRRIFAGRLHRPCSRTPGEWHCLDQRSSRARSDRRSVDLSDPFYPIA